MSKNWEVELTFTVTIAVEDAEDQEKAVEYGQDVLSFVSELDLTDSRCRLVTDPIDWDRVKRHAHEVARND